jgi:hypothetical protein
MKSKPQIAWCMKEYDNLIIDSVSSDPAYIKIDYKKSLNQGAKIVKVSIQEIK